jgi:hypothetical protein
MWKRDWKSGKAPGGKAPGGKAPGGKAPGGTANGGRTGGERAIRDARSAQPAQVGVARLGRLDTDLAVEGQGAVGADDDRADFQLGDLR